jgi:hypothetical protein
VLISPTEYPVLKDPTLEFGAQGLKLGENTVVFYETREHWIAYDSAKRFSGPGVRRLKSGM